MRLLVLGGTRFLGRAIVESALDAGHELTLFNRGLTNPGLFPEVEKIRGDRTADLSTLAGRDWDAVVDVATFLPRVVRLSVEALRDVAGRYWPRRLAAGGRVLAPGPPGAPVQFVDVRDLGAWIVRAIGDDLSGVFNATGLPRSFAEFLGECVRVTGADAEVVWVPPERLVEAGVGEWMELPLWIVSPEYAAAHLTDVSKAVAKGLTFRPLEETIRDTLAWNAEREWPQAEGVGLAPEREAQLLRG